MLITLTVVTAWVNTNVTTYETVHFKCVRSVTHHLCLIKLVWVFLMITNSLPLFPLRGEVCIASP